MAPAVLALLPTLGAAWAQQGGAYLDAGSERLSELSAQHSALRQELARREEGGRRLTVLVACDDPQGLERLLEALPRLLGAAAAGHQSERCVDGPAGFIGPLMGPAGSVRGWADPPPRTTQWCFDAVVSAEVSAIREAARQQSADAVLIATSAERITELRADVHVRSSVLDRVFGLVPRGRPARRISRGALQRLAAVCAAVRSPALISPPLAVVSGRQRLRRWGLLEAARTALAERVPEAVFFDDPPGEPGTGVFGWLWRDDPGEPLRAALQAVFLRKHLRVADYSRPLRQAAEEAGRAEAAASALLAASEESRQRRSELRDREKALRDREEALWNDEWTRVWRAQITAVTSAVVGLLLCAAAGALSRPILAEPVGRVADRVWVIIGPACTAAAASAASAAGAVRRAAVYSFQAAREELRVISEERLRLWGFWRSEEDDEELEEDYDDDYDDMLDEMDADGAACPPGLAALRNSKPEGLFPWLGALIESAGLRQPSRGWLSLRGGRAGLRMRGVTAPRVQLANQLHARRMRREQSASAGDPRGREARERAAKPGEGGPRRARCPKDPAAAPPGRWRGLRAFFAGAAAISPTQPNPNPLVTVSPVAPRRPPGASASLGRSQGSAPSLEASRRSSTAAPSVVSASPRGAAFSATPSGLSASPRRTRSSAAPSVVSTNPQGRLDRSGRGAAPGSGSPRGAKGMRSVRSVSGASVASLRVGSPPAPPQRAPDAGSDPYNSSLQSMSGSATGGRRRRQQGPPQQGPGPSFEQALLRGTFAPTRSDSYSSAAVGTFTMPAPAPPEGAQGPQQAPRRRLSASGRSEAFSASGSATGARQVTFDTGGRPLGGGMRALDASGSSVSSMSLGRGRPTPGAVGHGSSEAGSGGSWRRSVTATPPLGAGLPPVGCAAAAAPPPQARGVPRQPSVRSTVSRAPRRPPPP